GSVLGVLEEVIRVGHAMGYTMEGCEKDIKSWQQEKKEWVKELANNNILSFIAIQETKLNRVSHMDVKFMWGNSNYDFVCSDSLGNSGGILCIWESTVFKKDNVTISDSFVAIYGTWLPSRWNGDAILMGDFNEVRSREERRGLSFNPASARVFDNFISSSGLVDIKMEGYTFTWSHPSATIISKLDRFLVTDGILLLFPSITGICLDRHLSDHRLILVREVKVDFGPIPIIRLWTNEKRARMSGSKMNISNELRGIDNELDQGVVTDTILLRRHELIRQLNDIKAMEATYSLQKSKVRWAIEGDENSKYFHGIINKKRSQLAVRGVFVDGIWCNEPNSVKEAFFKHYQDRFKKPFNSGIKINFPFKSLIWRGVFHGMRSVWLFGTVGLINLRARMDLHSNFSGTLIPNVMDAKYVNDYRPISLTGSVYKVVTKIMANRLAMVIADIVFDSQSAFVAERQILDGPFILNEVLHWCKRKNKKAMFFKVDFAKAYDSVRWDYLIDVLEAFGFGPTWCKWIRGTFSYAKASVIVNGSPSNEFLFHGGLKQGDPLSPYLFILVMESLNLSVCKAVDEGLFQGDGVYSEQFFLGADPSDKKITWAAWDKVLASKKKGGLGVSSFYSLNRALLLKWVWSSYGVKLVCYFAGTSVVKE
nr:RNA-directed DNA polymerase, eukaryota [Tanacetum cinerariifolium]